MISLSLSVQLETERRSAEGIHLAGTRGYMYHLLKLLLDLSKEQNKVVTTGDNSTANDRSVQA